MVPAINNFGKFSVSLNLFIKKGLGICLNRVLIKFFGSYFYRKRTLINKGSRRRRESLK